MRLAPATLSGRLLLAAAVFLAAALVAASVVIGIILQFVVTDQVDQRLEAQIVSLAGALKPKDGRLELVTIFDGPPFDRPGSGWYWQIRGDGLDLRSRSLGRGTLEAPPRPFDWRHVFARRPAAVEGRDAGGRALHLRALQTMIDNRAVEIIVSAPRSAITGPLTRVLMWLVPAILVLGLALLGATLIQIRLGLKPLRRLREDLQAVRSGHLARIPLEQPAELSPVVAELNGLIEQNEQGLATARLHVANLAHGLKTPLASLSLAVRERTGGDADAMLKLTGLIETRIRHHLRRARANATGAGLRKRTALSAKVGDLVSVLRRIHAERGVDCTVSIDEELYVACEAEDLDEILGNLLDNAYKWAAASIRVQASGINGRARITIDDDGPGIPAPLLSEVFRPGRRLDETVAGDGFGLSISRELAELHGGTLVLAPGISGGLRVMLELPLA